ncbi:hypothetical protein Hanom_Chr11g01048501 [Helianthus anomalus]
MPLSMLSPPHLNVTANHQWRSLTRMTGGSKTYISKNFYRAGGSKTYIPKNFYTKTTYITLLSEKFGGSGAPPRPFYPSPMPMPITTTTRIVGSTYILFLTLGFRHPARQTAAELERLQKSSFTPFASFLSVLMYKEFTIAAVVYDGRSWLHERDSNRHQQTDREDPATVAV